MVWTIALLGEESFVALLIHRPVCLRQIQRVNCDRDQLKANVDLISFVLKSFPTQFFPDISPFLTSYVIIIARPHSLTVNRTFGFFEKITHLNVAKRVRAVAFIKETFEKEPF